MTNKSKFQVKEFKDVFGYDIFLNISKQSNKNYILYNKGHKTFIHNLSCWSLFDFLRKNEPVMMLNMILNEIAREIKSNSSVLTPNLATFYDNVTQDTLNDKKSCEIALIRWNKELYTFFQFVVDLYKVVVKDTDYRPVNVLVYEKDGDKYLNLYRKGERFSHLTSKPNDDFLHIKRLVYNICGNDDKSYAFFCKFLAFKLQNPEIVVPCHFIIRDNGGTGKTEILLNDILKSLFEVSIISQEHLMSQFNSFMVGSSIVWCEEVEGFNDEKKLKALTGSNYITLNEKFEKNKCVKNYNNFIIASNELRTLKIGLKDRRFSVIGDGKRLSPINGDWSETLFKDKNEYKQFFKAYEDNFDTEIQNFYRHLISLKVERLDITIPLDNYLRQDLINLNKPSELNFIDELSELGLSSMYKEIYPNRDSNFYKDLIIVKNNEHEPVINGYWLRLSDLYNLYYEYCKINSYQKTLSKRMFLRRVQEYDEFNNLFETIRRIRTDNDDICICLRFKNKKKVDT